ncbi:MAG: TIGR03086 family metal-binding protein [Acidimicrobiales bacterium]
MDPREQLAHILPTLTALVDCIEPAQLNHPTPCSRFTVHDVLDHMIVLGGSFAFSFRGDDAPETNPPPVYGWVPAAEFRKAMEDLLDAVTSPGAMERTISAPAGEMPGATFARFVAFDGLIHGWDLASATGLDYEPAPAVIASVDEFARGALTADMRDGDTFKDATTAPEDATPLQRLVAFSGRSVRFPTAHRPGN